MMHSSRSVHRSANQDHVLLQTGATGVGEVPMLKRFKLQFRDRRGGTAVGPVAVNPDNWARVRRKPKECWELYFPYRHI